MNFASDGVGDRGGSIRRNRKYGDIATIGRGTMALDGDPFRVPLLSDIARSPTSFTLETMRPTPSSKLRTGKLKAAGTSPFPSRFPLMCLSENATDNNPFEV
jgi:hypothetical protein